MKIRFTFVRKKMREQTGEFYHILMAARRKITKKNLPLMEYFQILVCRLVGNDRCQSDGVTDFLQTIRLVQHLFASFV